MSYTLQKMTTISILVMSHLTNKNFIEATSMKMDFLPLGDVRTDPIINPTCLSDHVHTFYGVNIMRPETTYEDLRSATGNTGNIEENKSLYWHPTVYKVNQDTGLYTKVDIWFASAYYIWETGNARAFPNGFKMVTGNNGMPGAKAGAECVNPYPCERDDGCESDDTSFFPSTACGELEVSLSFPTCWDGINVDSDDHQSHVSYDLDGGVFDGECPSSHPIKIPQIQLFFRILNYSGGKHIFADGTSFYHADYFSGWDDTFLQTVLDECFNDSEAAMPDAWCEDHVTFLDAPKFFDENKDDAGIVSGLLPFQPDTFDTSTITTEEINGVTSLPRGACSGTLVPIDGTNPSPSPPTQPPINNNFCNDYDEKMEFSNGSLLPCKWVRSKRPKLRRARCRKRTVDGQLVSELCPVTCLDASNPSCVPKDVDGKFPLQNGKLRSCNLVNTASRVRKKKLCKNYVMLANCPEACGL